MFPAELERILKDVSRTLYLSINILPNRLKAPMALGYLVARTMDTLVDCPAIEAKTKREMLGLFRGLENASNAVALDGLVERAVRSVPNPKEQALLSEFKKIAGIYASFQGPELAALRTLVNGVACGMDMDLDIFTAPPAAFGTEAELERYCGLIGGEPGVFWARLYGETIRRNGTTCGDFPSEKDASLIGSALQITNVLKDMSADLRIGRCYLPQSELAGAGLRTTDLLDPGNMGALRPVVNKWILWAVSRLDLSEKFLSSIPRTEPAMRAAFIWPVFWATIRPGISSPTPSPSSWFWRQSPISTAVRRKKSKSPPTAVRRRISACRFIIPPGPSGNWPPPLIPIRNGPRPWPGFARRWMNSRKWSPARGGSTWP